MDLWLQRLFLGLALSDRSYANLLSLTSDVQYRVCSNWLLY